MSQRKLDCIKDVLNEREYQAVTKLIEEVNNKSMSEDSVSAYMKKIKETLNTVSYRKDMLTHALQLLEKYIECGKRAGFEFEESIKGSRLLETENRTSTPPSS